MNEEKGLGMPRSRPTFPMLWFAACALIAATVVGTGGCKSASTATPGPRPSVSPSPSPTSSPTGSPSPTATANVFVSMAYASMSPTIDPTYGEVDGYAAVSTPIPVPSPSASPSFTPGPSSIVTVPCNVNIQFLNFDTSNFHAASRLVPQNGGFPPYYNNNNGLTASVPGTPLSDQQFSTGFMNTRGASGPATSAVYSTGASAGVYFFGDYFFYASNPSMRTVIIVQC